MALNSAVYYTGKLFMSGSENSGKGTASFCTLPKMETTTESLIYLLK